MCNDYGRLMSSNKGETSNHPLWHHNSDWKKFDKTNVTRYCSFLRYSQTPPMVEADREGQISEVALINVNLEASFI